MLKAFLFLYSDDYDGGQFEFEEDETDRLRRMISESPVNKILPIPESSAFFLFNHDNQ